METSGLHLSTSEETEEPWPKKIKIDRSHMSSEDEQQLWLQNLYYADKKLANKSPHFPEELWNFSQDGLELQEKKIADLNNVRRFVHFKQCMNSNLESRLLGNIQFYEKLTIDSNNCSIIRDGGSEFNENNPLVTQSEFWALHAKERNKSIDIGIILKGNELPTVNTIFYNIMIENLIKAIESLFNNVPELQSSENGKGCHDVCKMFRSEEKYHIPEPVTAGENINGKTSHLCSLANCLMKKRKSELGYLFYENKNVLDEDGDFLSCIKRTRFPANNHPRRNKASQHIFMPFSRICGIRNPKLVKCAAFELLIQDEILHNSSIKSKKNDTSVFSQGLLFNIQKKEVSKESRTKKCLIFSKNTREDYIDSVSGNEKEQMSKQFLFFSNQISPKNNVPNSTLWEKQLYNPKKPQDLRGNIKLLNNLSSSKNIFEKLRSKYSSLQMLVTVGTCLQEKKIKTYSKNVFPIKKQQTSHFIIRASKKYRIRTFKNNINLASKSKHALKYLRTCGRAVINKNKYGSYKDIQENSCVFIDTEAHFSSFDIYKKIYLNTDSEEVYLISFLKNVILNDKNNKKCSKRCTMADTRITYSVLDTLINSCVPPVLITNVTNTNSFLVQEKKNKKFLEYININSQWSKHEINDTPFPINGLNSGNKHFSDDDHNTTISRYLCKNQNIAVSFKAWHNKIALHGNRGKQSGFIIANIKDVVQSQPICRPRDSQYFKHSKIKKVEDENFLLQKYMLLGSIHSSGLESMNQNAEDVNKIENEGVEQSYTSKSHQHQNVIVPYSKDESAEYIESKDNVMFISCTQKEYTIEEHSSTKLKDRYEFEMKNQFDLVLEELCMVNEIDKKNGTRLLCGKINILQEDPLEQNHSDSILHKDARKVCENMTTCSASTCSTTLKFTMTMTQKENGESLFKDTVVRQTGKQEVLHDSSSSGISHEELFCSPSEEHCDSGCKQLSPWKPAFVYHTLMKNKRHSFQNEKGNCLSDGMIRVQPLKTCCRPLRIGLSRKAKLKQLHPYLK